MKKCFLRKLAFLALAAATALSFASCYNGTAESGEPGIVSLNVGRSITGNTMWNGIDVSTLYHTIFLLNTSSFEILRIPDKRNEAITFTVDPGNYLFYVEAYTEKGRKGDLIAIGYSAGYVRIQSGPNGTIPITMAKPPALPAVTITGNPWLGGR